MKQSVLSALVTLGMLAGSVIAAPRPFERCLTEIPSDATVVMAIAVDSASELDGFSDLVQLLGPMKTGIEAQIASFEPKASSEVCLALRLEDPALFTNPTLRTPPRHWVVVEPSDLEAKFSSLAKRFGSSSEPNRIIEAPNADSPGRCILRKQNLLIFESPCDPTRTVSATQAGRRESVLQAPEFIKATSKTNWGNATLVYFNTPQFMSILERIDRAALRQVDPEFDDVLAELLNQVSRPGPGPAVFSHSQDQEYQSISILWPVGFDVFEHVAPRLFSSLLAKDVLSAAPPEPDLAREETQSEPQVLTAEIVPPEALEKASPVYPPEAKLSRIEGKVILQIVVEKDGSVSNIKVLRSAGDLDQAAIDAVSQWRYKPATRDGVPLRVFITVIVNFKLGQKE